VLLIMEDIVRKAERKGRTRGRLNNIVGDIDYLIKVYEGKAPLPLHVDGMIYRYEAENFNKDKFGYVRIYGAVLDMLCEKGELARVDDCVLKIARKELLNYCHNIDF